MSEPAPGFAAKRLPMAAMLFMLASVVVIVIALLGRFHGFKVFDDAYMFVRYADHVIAGHGMAWNIGEGPVYGATSLAYVFALIPFRLLFPDNMAAALFSSSFFWGLVFLALAFRLGLRAMRPSDAFKPFVAGLLFLTFVATIVMMRAHFVSGMETTFVMGYLCLCLGLWEGIRLGRGNAWVAGIVGGLAWWVRPDLLIFTLGIPAATWMLDKGATQAAGTLSTKANWLRVVLVTLAVTGLALVGAKMVTGAWVPLSFFAKGTSLYGPEFASEYRIQPYFEVARFAGRAWPVLLMIAMGVYVKWPRLREAYSGMDIAVFCAMLVYGCYFTFFVIQVMGFGQRFYYPLLPFMLYLGIRELLELPENLRLGPGLRFKKIPTNLERIGTSVVAGVLLYYGISYGWNLKQSQLDTRFAVFSAKATYQADLTDYWAHLDELEGLPDDLEIATTEVGMPSALYPHRKIHDLAALNNATLMDARLSVKSILDHCAADLIYLPHNHYKRLNSNLAASKEFTDRYELFTPQQMKAAMGIGIRKDSPHAARLLQIFTVE